MNSRTLTILTMLLDLKAAAFTLLESRRRNPALLTLFTFIDICANLSNGDKNQNREIFEAYLKNFAVLTAWNRYTPYDLWASRSSLLHTYSPFGHHTKNGTASARPIFYFSWPEKKSDVRAALESRGYCDFLLLDVSEIKRVAVDAFNTMYRRVEMEPEFEQVFLGNAQHILPSLHYLRLEDELLKIDELAAELGR